MIRAVVDSRGTLASSDTINGIIGLAPTNDSKNPSYIESLYEKNIISNPVFSLLLCDEKGSGTSSITLGGQNDAYIKNGTNVPPPLDSKIPGQD